MPTIPDPEAHPAERCHRRLPAMPSDKCTFTRGRLIRLPVDKGSIRCHDNPTEQEGDQAADKTAGNDKGEKRWSS